MGIWLVRGSERLGFSSGLLTSGAGLQVFSSLSYPRHRPLLRHLLISDMSSPFHVHRAQWSVFPALAGTLDFSKYLHNLALIQGSKHPRSVSPRSPQRSGLRPSVDPAIDPHTLYPCTRRCRNGLWMEHMLILSGHSRPCPGPLLFTFYLTSVTMLLNELGANPPAVTEDQ